MEIKGLKSGNGLSQVYGLAIVTMLGTLLLIRFGYALGELGFMGAVLIVLVGFAVIVPSTLALSELATNQKVKGGGEYNIISRSFGLNLGAPIGIVLFLSQTISIAFYIIVFTEAFEPFFLWSKNNFSKELPRQIISVPAMILLAMVAIKYNSKSFLKLLYIVIGLIVVSFALFFIAPSNFVSEAGMSTFSFQEGNISTKFYFVFAIIFPVFTGMSTGMGIVGNLKNKTGSIPQGIILATLTGFIVFLLYLWKLANSFSQDELLVDYQIIKRIAYFGPVLIPLMLAVTSFYSAYLFISIAPQTLRALGLDESLPFKSINRMMGLSKSPTKIPKSAYLIVSSIAMVFVLKGGVDYVAQVISMLFMITYSAVCLVSFLYHFGSDPSYRPVFRSKWYLSLAGFLLGTFLMFKMNIYYANVSILVMIILYVVISKNHKDRAGVKVLFWGVLFQLNRSIQIIIQNLTHHDKRLSWRPSVICVSSNSFERKNTLNLLEWISYRYGFATYLHLIEDYCTENTFSQSQEIKSKLMANKGEKSRVYVDTLISSSFSNAISQAIQLPGISGMPNNIILFEFDKSTRSDFHKLNENMLLARSAKLDVLLLAASDRKIDFKQGIDVYIDNTDYMNSNLIILLSYIIIGHPSWKNSHIRIFELVPIGMSDEYRKKLIDIIRKGQLPISDENIEMIELNSDTDTKKVVSMRSSKAALTIIGLSQDQFSQYNTLLDETIVMGDVLFVNASVPKTIE